MSLFKLITKNSSSIGVAMILLNIVVFSLLTPGYDHTLQTISELNHKSAPYKLLINTGFTLGFILLGLLALRLVSYSGRLVRISGILMLLSFAIILYMTWFLPMDAREGVRTLADQIHTNTITVAVIVFLLAQIFLLFYFRLTKKIGSYNYTLINLGLGILFGIMSMYSNIIQSELINLSERGWMITFLVYLYFLPNLLKSTD